jgi:hypothetical protein
MHVALHVDPFQRTVPRSHTERWGILENIIAREFPGWYHRRRNVRGWMVEKGLSYPSFANVAFTAETLLDGASTITLVSSLARCICDPGI